MSSDKRTEKRLEWLEMKEEQAARNDALIALACLVGFFAALIWLVTTGVYAGYHYFFG